MGAAAVQCAAPESAAQHSMSQSMARTFYSIGSVLAPFFQASSPGYRSKQSTVVVTGQKKNCNYLDGPDQTCRIVLVVLPPFLFIRRWIVQNCTIQRLIKRNGGSTYLLHNERLRTPRSKSGQEWVSVILRNTPACAARTCFFIYFFKHPLAEFYLSAKYSTTWDSLVRDV
jgi:hypothetical protein